MKLSIIIPVYRSAVFLKDSLNSICINEVEGVEAIVVEDQVEAEQELERLVEESNKKISCFSVKLQGKHGVAAARNYGMEFATGEYVLFLDDDDYLESGALMTYLNYAKGEDMIAFDTKSSRVGRQTYLSNKEENERGKETQAKTAAGYFLRKEKKLSHISVLNVLFRRKWLEEHEIRFQEKYTYYSDLPFMITAITLAVRFLAVPELTYIKRIHNDPIQAPSLSQRKDEERFYEYLDSYQEAKKAAAGSNIEKDLERLLIQYFVTTFTVQMKRKKEEKEGAKKFEQIAQELRSCSKEALHTGKRYERRILKAAVAGKEKKVRTLVTRHLACKKIKEIVRKKNALCKTLYLHLFYRRKVKDNYVMFESFLGRSYSDSPKYVYEYLKKNEPSKYKCIWVLRDTKKEIPYGAIKVKRFGIRYAYYLAVAKYFVYNMRQPLFMKVKEEQVFCETWHGVPMKRLMFDQEEVTGPDKHYKENVYKQTRQWDYLVSANRYCTKIFKHCFLFENKIIETGYPRNDILHIEEDGLVERIRSQVGLTDHRKVILYAPTFRDDQFYQLGKYKYSEAMDFSYMKEALQGEYVLLFRAHYLIADTLELDDVSDFVINVSNYEDIEELYLISDILITDYSSVAFDYTNLKRPMIFFTYDLEKYREILRGFYLDLERELPGPIVCSTEEVVEAIRNIKKIEVAYKDRYDKFYETYCSLEDGQSTKRLVQQVFGNE